METKFNWEHFYELGYTESNMLKYEDEVGSEIIKRMNDLNDLFGRSLIKNIRTMLKYYDREFVLDMLKKYPKTFLIPRLIFGKRLYEIDVFCENGIERIKAEYETEKENAIFEQMGYLLEEDWQKVLETWKE